MERIEIIFKGEVIRILRPRHNWLFRVVPYTQGGFEVREYTLGQASEIVALFSSEYSFVVRYGDKGNENI